MLKIENLTYRIGGRVLLDQADATINPGHRVGLVGRNGTGKTTLLRLIIGELQADEGGIEIPPRWQVGMTSQETPGGSASLIDTVLSADRELVALTREAETATDVGRIADIHARLTDKEAHSAPARAARILAGLGFSDDEQRKPCGTFSGGWRMRVALAALLFSRPDLLLLDEPTNHLDLEASVWLESYLRRYPGTILLVSHQRDLLNNVAEQIVHLDQGKLTLYQGGYDRFEETRRMRLELNDKTRAKQQAERARIQSFVDRFRYKATKARQAQSRLKMLERMQPLPEFREDAHVSFDFPDPDPLPPPLYSLEAVDVGYDGKPVIRNLSLRLDADDRIALLGANGNGKSTLIKLLAGKLEPLAGQVTRSRKLRIGYFAQHQTDELDLDATPVIELGRKRAREPEVRLRAHLGRFGFTQERADTGVANLSGGEKARLLFALMTSNKPHILLLDEPANHLDIQSREALVQAINAFTGAVVMVSHDPHVVELTVDRFWLVQDGRVDSFDGDMNAYRSMLLSRGNGSGGADAKEATPRDQTSPDRKQQRRLAAERRNALAPLKRDLEKIEKKVERLETERERLTQALADPRLYEGHSQELTDLRKELHRLEQELQNAEQAWVGLQEAWDQAQASSM